eukprot:gene7954-12421_t
MHKNLTKREAFELKSTVSSIPLKEINKDRLILLYFLPPIKQCKTKLLQLTKLKKSLIQLNTEIVLVYRETEREIKKSPLQTILENFLCVNDSNRFLSKSFFVENSTVYLYLIDQGIVVRSKKNIKVSEPVDLLRFILEPDSLDVTDQLGLHLENEDYHYMNRVSKRNSVVNFDKALLLEKNKEIDYMSEITEDVKIDDSIESLVVNTQGKELTNVSSILKKTLDEKDSGGIGTALSLSILKPSGQSTREKLEKDEMKKYLSFSNVHTMTGSGIDEKTFNSFRNLKEIEKEDGLKQVLENRKKRRFFKLYAAKEYSVENILFYEAVKQFENQVSVKKRIDFAKIMIETFLNENSNLGINTSQILSEGVKKKYEKDKKENICDVLLFNGILADLMKLTLSDTFQRFENSKLFKEMKEKSKERKSIFDSVSESSEIECRE